MTLVDRMHVHMYSLASAFIELLLQWPENGRPTPVRFLAQDLQLKKQCYLTNSKVATHLKTINQLS